VAIGIHGFCWYEIGEIPTAESKVPTNGPDGRETAKPQGDWQHSENRRRYGWNAVLANSLPNAVSLAVRLGPRGEKSRTVTAV